MAELNDDNYYYGLFGGFLVPPLTLFALFMSEDELLGKGLSHAFVVWVWILASFGAIAGVLSLLGSFHGH